MKKSAFARISVVSLLLVGCGGGTDSSDPNNTSPPIDNPPATEPPPPSPSTLSRFSAPISYSVPGEPGSIVIFDFDRDGDLDVVVPTGGNQTVSVLLNNGRGKFQRPIAFAAGGDTTSIVSGDFNTDGIVDVVASHRPHQIAMLIGNTSGRLDSPTFYPTQAWATDLAVADLNLDGIPDLVASQHVRQGGEIFLSRRDGSLISFGHYSAGLQPFAVLASDLNADNIPDIATISSLEESLVVLLGNGDGTFQRQIQTPSVADGASNAYNLASCDFNGDAYRDILVNGNNNNLGTLIGNGNATFRNWGTYTGSAVYSVGCADANGDDFEDVFAALKGPDTFTVIRGDGSGQFSGYNDGKQQVFPSGKDPTYLAIADLNGDARPDVVTSSPTRDTVTVVLNTTK